MSSELKREAASDPARQPVEFTSERSHLRLGTEFELHSALERKREIRCQIAKPPVSEKLRMLEEMRDRAETIKASRRSRVPKPSAQNAPNSAAKNDAAR
jgi:hypothetical protein